MARKHARTCKNDPQRKARVIRAQQRQQELDALSPAERAAKIAENKARYDAEKLAQ